MLQRESGWKWDSPLFPWYSSRNRLQRQELDEIVRAGNETENARSAGLGTITCKVVDPSLRLLDRAEGVPFHSISTEDAMFVGKRKVRARIVLQPLWELARIPISVCQYRCVLTHFFRTDQSVRAFTER